MNQILKVVICLVAFQLLIEQGFCRMPPKSLAFAISPDGKTILAGGDTRTLYVIDSKKQKVTKRIRLDGGIHFIDFTQDGSKFLVDDSDQLRIFDSKTLKELDQVKNSNAVYFSPKANKLVFVTYGKIQVRPLDDLQSVREIPMLKDANFTLLAFSDDGKKMAILYSVNKSNEKRAGWNDAPKDLEGYKKEEWQKQHDGESGVLVIYDINTGKELAKHDSWFTDSWKQATLMFQDGQPVIYGSTQLGIRFGKDGKLTSFQPLEKRSQNLLIDPINQYLMSSDYKTLFVKNLKTNKLTELDKNKLDIDRFGSLKALTVDPTGNLLITTEYNQIIKMSPDGKTINAIPVY